MEKCPHGVEDLKFSEIHDCNFCPLCDVWTETACNDEECFFCRERPEKPSNISKSIIYVDYVGIEGVSIDLDSMTVF